jgi:hypothetical protein
MVHSTRPRTIAHSPSSSTDCIGGLLLASSVSRLPLLWASSVQRTSFAAIPSQTGSACATLHTSKCGVATQAPPGVAGHTAWASNSLPSRTIARATARTRATCAGAGCPAPEVQLLTTATHHLSACVASWPTHQVTRLDVRLHGTICHTADGDRHGEEPRAAPGL